MVIEGQSSGLRCDILLVRNTLKVPVVAEVGQNIEGAAKQFSPKYLLNIASAAVTDYVAGIEV